jgi:hypothetical protein
MKIRNKLRYIVASAGLASVSLLGIWASSASAASLSNTYVRLNRMSATTASSLRVVFRVPAGNSATEDSLKISFPDNFTIATAGQTSATAACATETGATALPGTLAVTGDNTVSTKNITVGGVTNLSANTTYCVDLTLATAVTNGAAGQYTLTVATQDNGPAVIDSVTAAVRVISNDQVVVSAVVPASFNFVLDANTTSFTTNLDSGSVVSTTGRTVTITTNAASGWITWVRDSNQGLTSATASKTIATSGTVNGATSTLSAGTEGYVLDVDLTSDAAGGGTVSIDAEYNGGANAGGTLSATSQPAATSNGTAGGAGDVITFVGKAAIAGDTPAAADYTDTWTIIGAGSY